MSLRRENSHKFLLAVVGALLISCVPLLTFAQSKRPSDSTPCKDAVSQRQMNACWSAAASDADQALRLELDKNREEQTLHDAQRHWAQYRDLQCKLEAKQSEGKPTQIMEESICLWRITQARAKELHQLRAMRPH
ncbi:Uncharacterized conserved protein YecT, DUF1311 family [Nitrosospira multiformis]|uniref:Uncharacterized conserved protein YecT, DUF1311 family n=1 Tax=Nitrosospira multiformis TaxID=1231 RepID=A0A1H8N3S6_9PROT|nr:Uncharacterized conserved protein YecT, DUF1311 family [Nitrosospira multiformis]